MSAVRSTGERASRGRVTIEQVAEAAGVSIATVSRVLNGHPDVSPGTRTEVMKQVRTLGYANNRQSSVESNGKRPCLIALAVPEMRGDAVTEIVTGAAEVLRDRDAHLVICADTLQDDSDTPLEDRLLRAATGGALLVFSPESQRDLAALRESGYPFVLIEPTMPVDESFPVVAVSHWAGAKMATEHLIGLGHTHIGIVTGPQQWRASIDRVAGYQAALLSAGLPLVPMLIQEADLSLDGGQEAASRLLSLPHTPSAIFALNDAMAIGALRAARERGLRVPRDVSVMGFDDAAVASVTTPALTTVQQPLQGLGRVGADMIWRLIQGQQLDAPRIELSTTLIVRDSTAPPRGTSFQTV